MAVITGYDSPELLTWRHFEATQRFRQGTAHAQFTCIGFFPCDGCFEVLNESFSIPLSGGSPLGGFLPTCPVLQWLWLYCHGGVASFHDTAEHVSSKHYRLELWLIYAENGSIASTRPTWLSSSSVIKSGPHPPPQQGYSHEIRSSQVEQQWPYTCFIIKVCEAHILGGSGGMRPRRILDFSPSEIISNAILGYSSES